MAKILFIPVSIISGLIAGFVGKKAFEMIWGVIDDQEPPDAEDRETSMPKLVASLAVQGAAFTITRGVTDHLARAQLLQGDRRPGRASSARTRPESASLASSSSSAIRGGSSQVGVWPSPSSST